MNQTRVTVVTVTYGNRWEFLSQVVSAVMKDDHVTKLVIVDNGSKNKKELEDSAKEYGDRIVVLRQENNTGSAGGFAIGLDYARNIDCDYIFTLDDDNVPEAGAIAKFLEIKKTLLGDKIVLCGNRSSLPGSQRYFHLPPLKDPTPRGTFFEIFSLEKFTHFFAMLLGIRVNREAHGEFTPVTPNEGFIYGGSFMPIQAVREAPLPDASLVLYGDDIEYSWGITRLGYKSYVCASPHIYDVDSSFGESHIFGLFNPQTHPFKVYYRIRNMVRISVRNTRQWQITLFFSIIIWSLGLCLLGLFKYGISKTFFKRVKLVTQAIYGGYFVNAKIPHEARLP